MIYVTGDIHADLDIKKLSNSAFSESRILTRNDYLVILGDFGFPFYDKEVMKKRDLMDEYIFWTHWLAQKPYTILFIDGNHENFNFWDTQEVTEKWGGKVQQHPDISNVFHLMRGEVYEIDGKKIFAFGGAVSPDWKDRVENVSYWKQEQATQEQIEYARKNLAMHDNKIDYIFTHTMPMELIIKNGYLPISDRGAEYLDEVLYDVDYKVWCCGHFHLDIVDKENKLRMFYNDIEDIRISETKMLI